MYHCFVLTSVIALTSLLGEPLEQREHRAIQKQIHNPEKRAEHDREEDHHDGRGVHLFLRRPRHALQLVADFDEEHARAIPPPTDVLARFSDVVSYHVRCHLTFSSPTSPAYAPHRSSL